MASDADRTASSKPTCRSISIVPSWKCPARGWIAVPAWRSTTSDGTPSQPSSIAVDSPTKLPPMIRTGVSSSLTFASSQSEAATLDLATAYRKLPPHDLEGLVEAGRDIDFRAENRIIRFMAEISATEASKRFADLLDAVEHRGETFTVVR